MVKWIVLLLLSAASPCLAQRWAVYGGPAASYDGFLRDASVTTVKGGWPFQVGGAIVAGGGYKATNGFNLFTEITAGVMNIQLPAPEVKQTRVFLNQFQTRIMAGSGPRIDVGDKGNILTPFIQLGGGYMSGRGFTSSNNDNLQIKETSNLDLHNWHILFGAGLDWQFNAIVPSSVNLHFTYAPLSVFRDPFRYTVTTDKSTSELALQGKLLQLLISYRVHLKLGKTKDWE